MVQRPLQRPRRVLIFSNLPPRDMQVDSILASYLGQMGFDVRLTPLLPRPREHVVYFKPDIVIGPEARCRFTIDFYKKCKDWGIWTVVRRCEGGTAPGAWAVMDDAEKATVIGAWPYDVDVELVWSEKFAEIIAENGYLSPERIKAIGGVPFDPYFKGPAFTRPFERRNLLICPGWGHADTNPNYNVPEAPPDSPIHKDAFDRHRKGREAWIAMIQRMRREAPPIWKIFLSLKVGELPQEYMQKIGNDLQIVAPGTPMRDLLANMDFIIHPGSTLGIEAHLSGIPGLSYCGLYNQTKNYHYPHVHPDTEDVEELVKRFKAFNSKTLRQSNANVESVKELEREFYGPIDGRAMERAAGTIASLPNRPTQIPDVWPPETAQYSHPGTSKDAPVTWICEACQRPTYVYDPKTTMIVCNWCGISLSRR